MPFSMTQTIRALPPQADHRPGVEEWRAYQQNARPRADQERDGELRDRFVLLPGGKESGSDSPYGKAFRFRIDPDARNRPEALVRSFNGYEQPGPQSADNQSENRYRSEVYDGLAAGDPARNAVTFLATLIAQTRMRPGLEHSLHADASDAYRLAGGKPPLPDDRPRLASFLV